MRRTVPRPKGLCVKLTEEELALLHAMAKAVGMTATEFIRTRIFPRPHQQEPLQRITR